MTNQEKYLIENNLKIEKFNQYGLDESAERSPCPLCSSKRKDPNDKCSVLDWDKGLGKCFNCGEAFQLHEVVYDGGPKKPAIELISDDVKKFFTDRGISPETLVKAGVGGENKKITFNYIKDDKIVKKKHRTTYDKTFIADVNGESVPYNIDSMKDQDEVIIVEGEIDALSFLEIGVKSVISVPNGANSKGFYKDYFWYFKDLKKVHICVDKDEAGLKLKENLEKEFSDKEISHIDTLDCKDANDFLVKHGKDSLISLLTPGMVVVKENPLVKYRSNLPFDFEEYSRITKSGAIVYDIPDMVVIGNISNYYVMLDGYGFLFPYIDNKIMFGCPIAVENFVSMIRDAGFKSTQEISRILRSPSIKKITPIDIFLHQLKGTSWDGKDRISEVISALNLESKEGEELIKKWFTNALAFTLRYSEDSLRDKPIWNKLVPILVSSERNWYKTTALRKLGMQGLLPKFFREAGADINIDIFTEWAGNLPEDKRELNVATSNSFIISIDDIDSMLISERGKGKLRSLISQETSTDRVLFASKNTTTTKKCVYIGSSNRIELLRDTQETRYLPLVLKGPINKDYFRNLDAFQFWAQVYSIVINSDVDDLNFTKDEMDSVKGLTADHVFESGLETWMRDNFVSDESGTLKWDDILRIMEQTSLRSSRPNEIRNALMRIADSSGISLKSRKENKSTGKMTSYWHFKFIGDVKIDQDSSNLPF